LSCALEEESESPDCPPKDQSVLELAWSEVDEEVPDWFEPIAPTDAELRFSGSRSSGMKVGSIPRLSSSGLINESPNSPLICGKDDSLVLVSIIAESGTWEVFPIIARRMPRPTE